MPISACAYDKETGAVYHTALLQYVHEGRRVGSAKIHSELVSRAINFFFDDNRLQSGSGAKIFNAPQSASIASRVSDHNQRLIAIWSAFEALLPHPSKDGENTVRINHFEGYITPLVTASYAETIFKNTYNDIAKSHRGNFYKFLNNRMKEGSRHERFMQIFFAEQKVKDDFMALINGNELLMYRLHLINKLANDPALFRSKIIEHERRVSWQLNRIYRARNSIVHSAQEPPTLPHLTENAFSYFKSLMSTLVQAGEKFGISSSDALFDLCASACNIRRKEMDDTKNMTAEEYVKFAVSPIF